MKKIVITKKEKPYSECTLDLTTLDSYPSEIFKTTFVNNNNSYSWDKCVDMCVQLHIIKNCGCYDIGDGVSPDPSLRPCVNDTDQQCNDVFSTDFENIFGDSSANRCDCPKPCQETIYETSSSLANFPSPDYAGFLASDPSFTER